VANLPLKIKLGIIAGLLIVSYWPTFIWMNTRFNEADTYYSHGFLVPFVFLYLIWMKRDDLKRTEISPLSTGLILLVPALLVHLIANFLIINFVSGFSLIAALFGLSLYLYGLGISRRLAFAILFLVFMIPLPQAFIISISFHMKIFAAQVATACINLMGIQALREGSIVSLPNTSLTIGDPCSGLRSLISLTALGALYAYLIKTSKVKKTALFLLSIPIALFVNIVRIIMLLLVAFVYGSEVATGKFHDFSGFLLFGFAFAGLFIAGRMLSWQSEK
jgi:exosortase A